MRNNLHSMFREFYIRFICNLNGITLPLIKAPRWQVEEDADCHEILRKGVAKGFAEIKVESD